MAAAVISGVGHDRLLRCADRAELVVEGMLVEMVVERQQQLEDNRIQRMANEIAKRFG